MGFDSHAARERQQVGIVIQSQCPEPQVFERCELPASAGSHFKRVAGVEVSPTAIHWANANAVVNQIGNAEFFIGEAESIFAQIAFPAERSSVVIDPPRKGCDAGFLQQLVSFSPRRVIYVSCHPATQARDLKELLANGYRLLSAQPFDLFPQTRHIENVVILEQGRVGIEMNGD